MTPHALPLALAAALAAPAAVSQPIEHLAPLDDARFAGGTLSDERVVKGAPYCADAVHETVQTLADGNRIVKRQASRLCRDGEGRTRQEVERGGRKWVYLRDPATRESWALDPERKTVRKLRGHSGGLSFDLEHLADAAAWRDYAERMRAWARGLADRVREGEGAERLAPPAPPAPPTPQAAPAVVRPLAPATALAPLAPVRDIEVQVVRLGAGEAPPALPPAVRWTAQVHAPRGPGVLTPLPAREIEGLRVNGERTTWTIPAGQLGNEKPIEIVREVWTSPELMVTVATRDFDPRSGEVNYRLANVRRGEPDPALMKLPADFAKEK
jgi:hypothetical protein